MWIFITHAPLPDVEVWPGRHALALLDALAWPVGWAALVLTSSVPTGVVGQVIVGWCAVAALRRTWRALAENHRYHFTTWRVLRWVLPLLVFAYAIKLAAWVGA